MRKGKGATLEPRVYQVTWYTELLAWSHHDAARLARAIQLDPKSDATVFTVRVAHGATVRVDTSED